MRMGLLLLGEHTPEALARLAIQAEELGYDYFWYADEKFYRDPYVGLTLVALKTKKIRLGVCVTDPYSRHPALSAMANASLAEIAPGRVVLGFGAGGSGFPQMGIRQEKSVVALREGIEIMRRLFAGETVDYEGQVLCFRGGRLEFSLPNPVPIHVGTMSKLNLQLAGEIAEGVMIGGYASARGIEQSMQHVRRGAERAGRDLHQVEISSRVNLCIAKDRSKALETVKPMVNLSLWLAYPNFKRFFDYDPSNPAWNLPEELCQVLAQRDYNQIGPSAHLVPDGLVPQRALVGTIEEVTQQAYEIAELGIKQIVIFPMPGKKSSLEEQIALFAGQVMPAVRKRLGCIADEGTPCGWDGFRCNSPGCQRQGKLPRLEQ